MDDRWSVSVANVIIWSILIAVSIGSAFTELYLLKKAVRKGHALFMEVLKPISPECGGDQQEEENGENSSTPFMSISSFVRSYLASLFHCDVKELILRSVESTVRNHVFVEGLQKVLFMSGHLFNLTVVQILLWFLAKPSLPESLAKIMEMVFGLSSAHDRTCVGPDSDIHEQHDGSTPGISDVGKGATRYATLVIMWALMLTVSVEVATQWGKAAGMKLLAFRTTGQGWDDTGLIIRCILWTSAYLVAMVSVLEFDRNPFTVTLLWVVTFFRKIWFAIKLGEVSHLGHVIFVVLDLSMTTFLWLLPPIVCGLMVTHLPQRICGNWEFDSRWKFIRMSTSTHKENEQTTLLFFSQIGATRALMYLVIAAWQFMNYATVVSFARRQTDFIAQSGMMLTEDGQALWVYAGALLVFVTRILPFMQTTWSVAETSKHVFVQSQEKTITLVNKLTFFTENVHASEIYASSSDIDVSASFRRVYRCFSMAMNSNSGTLLNNAQGFLRELNNLCERMKKTIGSELVHFSVRNCRNLSRSDKRSAWIKLSSTKSEHEKECLLTDSRFAFNDDGAWELSLTVARSHLSRAVKSLSDTLESQIVTLDTKRKTISCISDRDNLRFNTLSLVKKEPSHLDPFVAYMQNALHLLSRGIEIPAVKRTSGNIRAPMLGKTVTIDGVLYQVKPCDPLSEGNGGSQYASGLTSTLQWLSDKGSVICTAVNDLLPTLQMLLEQGNDIPLHTAAVQEDESSDSTGNTPTSFSAEPQHVFTIFDTPVYWFPWDHNVENMNGIMSAYYDNLMRADFNIMCKMTDDIRQLQEPARTRTNDRLECYYRTYSQYNLPGYADPDNIENEPFINTRHSAAEFMKSPFCTQQKKLMVVSSSNKIVKPCYFRVSRGVDYLKVILTKLHQARSIFWGTTLEKALHVCSRWLMSALSALKPILQPSCYRWCKRKNFKNADSSDYQLASMFCPSSGEAAETDTTNQTLLWLETSSISHLFESEKNNSQTNSLRILVGSVEGSLDLAGKIQKDCSEEINIANVLQMSGSLFQFLFSFAELCCNNLIEPNAKTMNLPSGRNNVFLPYSGPSINGSENGCLAERLRSRLHIDLCGIFWRIEHCRRALLSKSYNLSHLHPCFPVLGISQPTSSSSPVHRLENAVTSFELDALRHIWRKGQLERKLGVLRDGDLLDHCRSMCTNTYCACRDATVRHERPIFEEHERSAFEDLKKFLKNVTDSLKVMNEHGEHIGRRTLESVCIMLEERNNSEREKNLIEHIYTCYFQLRKTEKEGEDQEFIAEEGEHNIHNLCQSLLDHMETEIRQNLLLKLVKANLHLTLSLMKVSTVRKTSTMLLLEFLYRFIILSVGEYISLFYVPPGYAACACQDQELLDRQPTLFSPLNEIEAAGKTASLQLCWGYYQE